MPADAQTGPADLPRPHLPSTPYGAGGDPVMIPPLGEPQSAFRVGELVSVGEEAVGRFNTGGWLVAAGRPVATAAAVLMDDALAHAVLLHRPTSGWVVTTEISLEFLRPLPTDGRTLTVRARAVSVDDEGGCSAGVASDEDGTPYVAGTSWLKFTPGIPEAAQVEGSVPPLPILPVDGPSLADLIGAREAEEGARFHPDDHALTLLGTIHGGAMLAMAEHTARTLLADSAAYDVQSIRAVYARPGLGELTGAAVAEHDGRSLKRMRVSLTLDSGKPAVLADVVFRPAVHA